MIQHSLAWPYYYIGLIIVFFLVVYKSYYWFDSVIIKILTLHLKI